MPPKKTRAPSSSSQPTAITAPKPTRSTGRKRRHSDGSNASEQSTASAPVTTAAKRQKKGKKVDEVIIEEDADDMSAAAGAAEGEDIQHDLLGESIELYSSEPRHVHFGSATNGEADDAATATHVTPHPNKTTLISRRIAESPGASKRFKTTIRSSLPPQWSQDHASLAQSGSQSQEFNFAPLNEVLESRIRQRQSIGAADRQLAVLGDDDMLVLEKEPEIAYPQLTTPQRGHSLIKSLFGWSSNGHTDTPVDSKSTIREITTTSERVSLGASAQVEWDLERRKLQDAIVALSRDANDAKTRFQVLEMELQGLGFGGEDADVHAILETIRESFLRVRVTLEEQLTDIVPEDASFQDILEITISNVRDYAKRVRVQNEEIEQKTELIADLGTQIQGLLDRLADVKISETALDKVNRGLDRDVDAQHMTIVELEEQITVTMRERDDLLIELGDKQEEAQALGEDHHETLKNIEKLQSSLEHYRIEEQRLTVMITTMERSHNELIASVNKEREETVRDLEDRLDEEAILRGEAQKTSEERQTIITQIEKEIETLEGQYEELQSQLVTVQSERDEQRAGRTTAETGLKERTEEVEDFEDRVDRLEIQLTTLNTQIVELRSTCETQRTQLEVTETDLDDRNVEITELNEKLQIQGKAANELRGKLFEVQQQHKNEISELNQLMSDRDEVFQSDMLAEVTRREGADQLAQERATTIITLETQLEEVETEMQGLLTERDERIATLEVEVGDQTDEITTLRQEIRTHETLLTAQKAQHKKDRHELEASIVLLQTTITRNETTIVQLEQSELNNTSLHDSEMEDRNSTIAQLHADITSHKRMMKDLEAEKAGLERRVEQEAEQMLELQNEKYDEIEALKLTIRDKQQKIQVVETKAIEADKRWEEVLNARDEEIDELRTEMTTTSSSTTEAITLMQSAFGTLLHKFKAHVRRSSAVNDDLRAKISAALGVVDLEGEALLGESEAAIEEIEAMDVLGQMQALKAVSTTTTMTSSSSHRTSHAQSSSQTSASQSSAKKGRGRKKRLQDSGISMEAEEAS